MIIDTLIRRINEFPKGVPKVLELPRDEYEKVLLWATGKDSPLMAGDTVYNSRRGCYVFAGFDIKCVSDSPAEVIGAAIGS